MGMFANYAQITNPTQADDLDPQCPACKNTGWVVYPVNVTIGIDEHDECPNGCEQQDDNWVRDYFVRRQPIALGTIPEDLHDAYYASLKPDNYSDPLIYLAKGPRTRSLVGWRYSGRPHPKGRITTDCEVLGFVELEDGERVFAVIPPYLPGTPVDTSPLVVEYEYLGARITVRFHRTQADQFRFAYGYEDGYSTGELL